VKTTENQESEGEYRILTTDLELPSTTIKQLTYDSREISILRKWMYGEMWKSTPICSELELNIDMNESKDVCLLKNLASFALPPIDLTRIKYLSKREMEVKHFLAHSLGELRDLSLNSHGELLDGNEWVETIAKILPRVKEKVTLKNASLSKEQVEAIVNNSFHLKTLVIREWKLRKLR
jgi:hypothetical protein